RVLAEAVLHFAAGQAEVTLGAGTGDRIGLRSHVDDVAEPSKAMVTELWLGRDEFQAVAVAPGSRVTFCLKEFRALLSFAEASNLSLTIHYDTPGRPLVVTAEDTVLEVHLVLATLSDLESSSRPSQTNHVSHLAAPSDDDLESYMIALEAGADEGGSGVPPSPTFPLRTPRSAPSDPEEEEEEEEAAVPGTPPHKKFRSLFFGSVLTPGGAGPAPSQEVLAEDSDGEN
ncbi:RAD9A protein, partial [Piaya cayana]|nr:RAD9A protein [Piaya cayana]